MHEIIGWFVFASLFIILMGNIWWVLLWIRFSSFIAVLNLFEILLVDEWVSLQVRSQFRLVKTNISRFCLFILNIDFYFLGTIDRCLIKYRYSSTINIDFLLFPSSIPTIFKCLADCPLVPIHLNGRPLDIQTLT